MIITDRTITVRKGVSSINEPVVVYRGDYEIVLRFTIMNSKFKFMSRTNMIESEKASYAQLVILTPYGGNIFSAMTKCSEGAVAFVMTQEMLDQIEEVGLYSFQIRLFDVNKESRITIPPVEFGIEIREPIASEDHDNTVNLAVTGYASVRKSDPTDYIIENIINPNEENVGPTFDDNGDYNKNEWTIGKRISQGKLNKIEDAIDTINQNEKALGKKVTTNYNVLNSTKADKNEIFTMANMGQDVKEAMTGGSVAVVGKNAILSENIVNGQVTPEKLVMPLGSLTVYELPEILTTDIVPGNKRVKVGGIFIAHASNKHIALPYTEYDIPDGHYLVLDYKNQTISSMMWNEYSNQMTNDKYILFSNLDGELQSPIPLYQGVLNSIYNNSISAPLGALTVYELPEILTTDIVQGDKRVKVGGIFIAHTFDKFIELPYTEYDIPDGYYLVLDYKNQTISSMMWNEYPNQMTNDKYILFSNFAGELQSPIPSYQGILDNIYRPVTATGIEAKGIITVAKSGGQFTSISDAVASANSDSDNPVTIMVYPGVYNESVSVQGNKHISIIGMNKLTCILKDDSGQYDNAPLEIQGNAYIANMTFIATHDNDTITNVDSLRAYAVHADYSGEGTCEFNNCIMISKQNAALGSGLHTNQTLKIVNCELYSETPAESSMIKNGALFVHDGHGATNQKLIVKDSVIKSLHGCSHYLNGVYGTEMTAHFYNNVFWCDETGKDSIHLDRAIDGISANIKLSNDSFGNNTEVLNK